MNRKRWLVLLVAAIVAVAGLWASQSASASRGPTKADKAASVSIDTVAPLAAKRYSCPVGDGSASWGDAKVCTDPQGARFHFRDKTTDGYCVRMRYWSADNNAWLQTGPTACTTGTWVTSTDCCSKLCSPNVRLYRDDGAYFTPPNNYC